MSGDRFGIRRFDDPGSDRGPNATTRPWWKHPAAIALWVILGLAVLGSFVDAGDDPQRQNPVIDLDETPAQERIVARCEARLDAYFSARNPTQDEQLDYYEECLRDLGYAEAGQP